MERSATERFIRNAWPMVKRVLDNIFSFIERIIKASISLAINQIKQL